MKLVTMIFIGVVAVLILLYDGVALLRGGGRATISSIILAAAYTPPYGALIPFVFGALVVHLLTGKPE